MVTDFMMQRLIPSEDDMLLESFSGPVSQVWQKCKKTQYAFNPTVYRSIVTVCNVMKAFSCFCNEHLQKKPPLNVCCLYEMRQSLFLYT